jgi:hypothetical protein
VWHTGKTPEKKQEKNGKNQEKTPACFKLIVVDL